MKKYTICLLAAGFALAASAFTYHPARKQHAQKMENYLWFDYNGGLLQQCDPNYYSVDPNNFPDCPSILGLVYCEVRALPLEEDNTKPDLNTVIESRFRLLL